jgi:hypothetical protein
MVYPALFVKTISVAHSLEPSSRFLLRRLAVADPVSTGSLVTTDLTGMEEYCAVRKAIPHAGIAPWLQFGDDGAMKHSCLVEFCACAALVFFNAVASAAALPPDLAKAVTDYDAA